MQRTQNGIQHNELNDIECLQMHNSVNALLSYDKECNNMTPNAESLE